MDYQQHQAHQAIFSLVPIISGIHVESGMHFFNIFEMHLERILDECILESTWILSKSILDFVPLPSCASWNGKDSQIQRWRHVRWIVRCTMENQIHLLGSIKIYHLGFLFFFGKGTLAKTLKREMMVGTEMVSFPGTCSGGYSESKWIFSVGWNRIKFTPIQWVFFALQSMETYLRSLKNPQLVGGFKYLLFSSLLGEMIQFD